MTKDKDKEETESRRKEELRTEEKIIVNRKCKKGY